MKKFTSYNSLIATTSVVIGLLIGLGFFICYELVDNATDKLNREILRVADTAAAGLDPDNVEALTGTVDDIGTENFTLVRRSLLRIKQANPEVRFVYLMGIRDGRLIFLADAESPGSEDYSPPGQVYDEASPEMFAIFEDGVSFVEGPFQDRWGEWVSGTATIADPASGRVAAVLGIDQDASKWYSTVRIWLLLGIGLGSLPILVTLVFFSWLLGAIRADRAKTMFLANMSHEIRTPLNGIIGMVEVLSETASERERDKYHSILKMEASALLEIVNDILDFSKIEAGKVGIEHVRFDLHDLIDSLAGSMETRARRKGLRLSATIAPDVPARVVGDPARLRQVLTNLLTNAIKFTPVGNVGILVRAERQMVGRVKVHFSVIDTGVGIPPEAQALIFKGFAQADSSTTRKYGGTGLGVTISKKLVGLMGGQMGVESEVGHGSTFWFQLPLERAAVIPARREETPHELCPGVEGFKILVVDDYPTNLMVTRRHLENAGLAVETADSGQGALDLLEAQRFDLVFLDLNMPGMDGFDVIRQLRALESERGVKATPVVALTANASGEIRQLCRERGMDDYLVKPTPRNTLLAAVSNWCGQEPVGGGEELAESGGEPGAGEPPLEYRRAIEEFEGDKDFLDGVVDEFVILSGKQITELRGNISAGDAQAAARNAHNLKGGAANLRARQLASIVKRLEAAAREGHMEAAAMALEEVSCELSRLAAWHAEHRLEGKYRV